jgi:hypothetical protein
MDKKTKPVQLKINKSKHAYTNGEDHVRILMDSSRVLLEKAKTKEGEAPRVIESIATYTAPDAKPKEKPRIKHLANMSDPIDMILNKDKKHDPPKKVNQRFNPNYLGSYNNNVIDSKPPSKNKKHSRKTGRK